MGLIGRYQWKFPIYSSLLYSEQCNYSGWCNVEFFTLLRGVRDFAAVTVKWTAFHEVGSFPRNLLKRCCFNVICTLVNISIF